MRDLNEPINITSRNGAKLKQRLAGGAVLILVLAIFMPFIFKHTHNMANQAILENGSAAVADQSKVVAPSPAAPPANTAQQPVASATTTTTPPSTDNNQVQSSLSSDQPGLTPPQSESNNPNSVAAQPAQSPPPPPAEIAPPVESQPLPPPTYTQAKPKVAKPVHTVPVVKIKALPKTVAPELPPPTRTLSKSKIAATGGQWQIQVGSFSQAQSAKELVVRLRSYGIPSYTVPGPHHMVRVYAGPLTSQQQAQSVQRKIRSELHINGFIVKNHS